MAADWRPTGAAASLRIALCLPRSQNPGKQFFSNGRMRWCVMQHVLYLLIQAFAHYTIVYVESALSLRGDWSLAQLHQPRQPPTAADAESMGVRWERPTADFR